VSVVLERLDVRSSSSPRPNAPGSSESRTEREQALLTRGPPRIRVTSPSEHDELVNSVHRDELARTQQRMRIEQLEERALEELGLDPRA
jgi:chromosome segregation protein